MAPEVVVSQLRSPAGARTRRKALGLSIEENIPDRLQAQWGKPCKETEAAGAVSVSAHSLECEDRMAGVTHG